MLVQEVRALRGALAALVLGAAAPVAAATPLVFVSPGSGPPGTVVTVSGKGFCVADACGDVELVSGSAILRAGIDVRPDGGFRVRVVIGAHGTAGEQPIAAIQRSDYGDEIIASAAFDLLVSENEEAEKKERAEKERSQPSVVPGAAAASEGRPLATGDTPADGRTSGDRRLLAGGLAALLAAAAGIVLRRVQS